MDIPVYGAGNVKRMEDIKKLLYAGCKKACLNFSKAGNIEIIEEVSLKFGKEKIVACVSDVASITQNADMIEKYIDSGKRKRIEGSYSCIHLPYDSLRSRDLSG